MRRILGLLAAGAIGIVVGPAIAPALGRSLRPLARGALKSGIMAYERGRQQAAVLGETLDDVRAEAMHDLHRE
jgi:hypothetical protein